MATAGVVLAAMLVLGTVDTLVWLPQYLAPTTPLDRILAVLSRSGDLPWVTSSAMLWLVFWSLLGALYVLLLLPGARAFRSAAERLGALGTAAIGCLLIGAAGFFHWWSAFGMGMSVSDELPPYIGGTTPFGAVLALGGLGVGVVGLLLGALAMGLGARSRRSVLAQ